MKRLILMRHAKSDWGAHAQNDHARPINRRGEEAARAMGRALTLANQVPDRVLSSSAVRARTAAELAAEAGDWACPIEITDDLYHGGVAAVIESTNATGDQHQSLMLVGHQPTWSEAVSVFVGGGKIAMRTATAAAIDFDVRSWAAVEPGRGELAWLLPPRLFTDGAFDL